MADTPNLRGGLDRERTADPEVRRRQLDAAVREMVGAAAAVRRKLAAARR